MSTEPIAQGGAGARLIGLLQVLRRRHPGDGRMRVLTVTPAGAERLVEQLDPVLDVADDHGYTRAPLM